MSTRVISSGCPYRMQMKVTIASRDVVPRPRFGLKTKNCSLGLSLGLALLVSVLKFHYHELIHTTMMCYRNLLAKSLNCVKILLINITTA